MQGLNLSCGTRQTGRTRLDVCHAVCSCSVLPQVLLVPRLAGCAHQWAPTCCELSAWSLPLCVSMCVLLSFREGSLSFSELVGCLQAELQRPGCSAGAVPGCLLLISLPLFLHSAAVQASGSSDSQHARPAREYLQGTLQI